MSTPTLEILPASEFEHDIFTPMEAAQILRVGRTTIYNLISAHQIRYIKCGRKILIPRVYLQDFIEKNTVMCYNDGWGTAMFLPRSIFTVIFSKAIWPGWGMW